MKHRIMLPVLLVTAAIVTLVSSYQHPQQVLHQLRLAHNTAEELKTNPDHILFKLHKAFKGLTPERVYQEIINLATTSSASNSSEYQISEICANQTIFMMENIKMPTQTHPSWAANSKYRSNGIIDTLDECLQGKNFPFILILEVANIISPSLPYIGS